ncbi:hypothetical protein [Glycomyces tenuis]|uniref:hypothetical protein n=1 Tax=Glycomyces tenuis TaxID=58116 RepID=UPI00040A47CA|nr:hypothetical protein [Glycomyces tenuis]
MARELDPEALDEYRTLVQEQLDHIDTIIPRLKNGNALGRLPAFGQLDASVTARTNYETFHQTTWENLQTLRASLSGIMRTLDDSAALATDADEDSASELEDYESELTGGQ